MPMFRDFVPHVVRPWIFLSFAVVFQLTGGVYLASLSQMVGGLSLMREDVLMCFYASLVGLSLPFPLLFRMKFRFVTRNLLLTSAIVILVCNVAAMYVSSLPVLWFFCFLSGYFKLQGTFECMSNIQLWMTPKRDFTVFFPLLYIIVLGDIQMSGLFATYITYLTEWRYMHYAIVGLLLTVVFLLFVLTRPFRLMPKLKLYGVDWLGLVLWAALLLQAAYIFAYGEHYNWFESRHLRVVGVTLLVTAFFCIGRMLHIRHPFIEPELWRYRNFIPFLFTFFMVEMLVATPEVLQEILTGDVLRYDALNTVSLNFWMLAGILLGSLFSYWALHHLRMSYIRVTLLGFAALVVYQIMMYFYISPDINIERFYLPTMLRSWGYMVLTVAFTIYLEEIMSLKHFFQGLCAFGMVRTGLGSAIGAASYGFGLRYFMADNIERLAPNFDAVAVSASQGSPLHLYGELMEQVVLMSTKQLYGLTSIVGVVFIVLLLVYDGPVRILLRNKTTFPALGRRIRLAMRRQ